uniref:Uncharacterized protein n=1 Tax=Anguilla anguilla TaxID=7936 RepID=A0A0E9QAU8_ANGAN
MAHFGYIGVDSRNSEEVVAIRTVVPMGLLHFWAAHSLMNTGIWHVYFLKRLSILY